MPIKWKTKDITTAWKSFTQRVSSISGKGYKATHPVNALLNYAYAILAGQVERALQIAGLDVAVGSLHANQDGRASLVLDLMEPLRPTIDQTVFTWASSQRWRRADFVVDRLGVIRLHPQLGRVVVKKAMLQDAELVILRRSHLPKTGWQPSLESVATFVWNMHEAKVRKVQEVYGGCVKGLAIFVKPGLYCGHSTLKPDSRNATI